jgi:hypothetical protein
MKSTYLLLSSSLLTILGCGHGGPPAPAATPTATTTLDGTFLVDPFPETTEAAWLEIRGTQTTLRPVTANTGGTTATLVGEYPAFRLLPAPGKDAAAPRLLFTSPDGGWLWHPQQKPTRFHRPVALPASLRGKWAVVDPSVPAMILAHLDLQPTTVELLPAGPRQPSHYFATPEGGLGFRALPAPGGAPEAMSGQLFPGEGFVVLELNRNAILLVPDGKPPVWLTAPAATGPAPAMPPQVFHGLDNGFLKRLTVRLDAAGAHVETGNKELGGELGAPRFADATWRFWRQPGTSPLTLLATAQRAWFWVGHPREPGTVAVATTTGPARSAGEWTASAVNSFPTNLASVRFTATDATLTRHDGRTSTWTWADRGLLFSDEEYGHLQVLPIPGGWVMANPAGNLNVLHQGPPPAWAQSRATMRAQLGKLCQLARTLPDGPQAARVAAALAQLATQEAVSELLEKTVREASEQFGTGALTAELGALGVPFPPGCFAAP